LIDQWSAEWGAAVIGLVLLSLVLLAILLFRHRQNDELRINQSVRRHSGAFIKDAVIPDGIEGYLFADYLLRLGRNVIVLNVESRRGYVFGAVNIEEWTCVENNRTEKFNNPLQKATLFARQVGHISGINSVRPLVLFDSSSEFPKGVPEGVLQMTNLDQALESLSVSNGDDSLEEVWPKLVALIDEGRHQLNATI